MAKNSQAQIQTLGKTNTNTSKYKMPEQTSQKRELLEHTRRQNLQGVLFLLIGFVLFASVVASVWTTIRSAQVSAATSSTINFQARLQSAAGGIVPDGNYNIEFKLYDAGSGGTALWTETRENRNGQGVTVRNGYVSVSLGSVTAFPGTINWDQDLWLTMNIGGTTTGVPGYDGEMNPRLKLTATPYAFQAKSATQLQTLQGSYTGTLNFGSLTDNRSIALPDENGTICLQGSSNCGFLTTAAANSSYIQLQGTTPGTAQTGNFNISGTGIAGILQSGQLAVNGTVTSNVAATIQGAANATASTLVVKAATGQSTSAYLLDLQNASGNSIANFDTNGVYHGPQLVINNNPTNAAVAIRPSTTGQNGLAINGLAKQTGDMIYVTDNTSNTIFRVDSYGNTLINPQKAPTNESGNGTNGGNNGYSLQVMGQDGGNTTGTTGQVAGAGGSILLQGGNGGSAGVGSTSGNGGSITLSAGASSTAWGGTVGSAGKVLVKNQADSATAFQVQTSGGSSVLNVDTANGRIGVNTASPVYNLDVNGTVRIGGQNASGLFSIINGGSKSIFVVDSTNNQLNLNADANATAFNTINNAMGIQFNGNYWDGSAKADRAFTIQQLLSTTGMNSRLAFMNNAGTEVITFNDDGTSTFTGQLNGVSGFAFNGTAGATTTCSSGEVLQNAVIQGGIVTGGTCAANGGGINAVSLQATTPGTAQTGNFNISGTGMMNTLRTNYIDRLNTTALNIGTTTNTTNISIGRTGQRTTIDSDITANGQLFVAGMYAGDESARVKFYGNLNSTATTNQYGLMNQLSFNPQGASLGSLYGMVNLPTISGSSLDIPTVFGMYTRLDTASGYTGTIQNGRGLAVGGPTIAGSKLIPDYRGIEVGNNSSNGGNTTGTINNFQIRIQGSTAGAGTGGTLNNYGINITLANGTGGTTRNYGLYLDGNGGAGSTNYAIYNTSTAQNYIQGSVGIGYVTPGYKLDVNGDINTSSGYRVNGTAGSTVSCTGGQVLQNAVVQGGIVTGGSCAANGGGVAPTLQDTYNNSTSPATILLNSTNKGITIQDASTTVGGNLFAVQNNAGTTSYLAVTTSGVSVGGSLSVSGSVTVGTGQTLTLTGGNTAGRPVSPTEGTMYFDTTTKQLLVYANSKWQADRSTANKIVAMGAVTGCTGTAPVASANPDGADYVSTSCTSSQTVINNAINALPSGGGTVYLMDGTYIIDGSITLNSNVTLVGSGPSTVIKLANGTATNTYAISATAKTRIAIRNLLIDGNKANNAGVTQRGIYLSGVGSGSGSSAIPGANISNVEVTNFISQGIYMTTATNTVVQASTFVANGSDGMYVNGTRLTVEGNHFQGNGGDGINAVAGVDSTTISDNIVDGSTRYGIEITGSNNTLTNNAFNDNTLGGLSFGTLYRSVVSSNTIFSNGSHGIYATGANNNTITNNTIYSNAGTGIYLFTSSSYNTISGNNIYQNTERGLYLWNSDDYNQITGNTVTDNGGTGSFSSFDIRTTGNLISGNKITDTAGTGYAINITGSNNTLSTNVYSGTGASSINDTGTGTIYSNQTNANGYFTFKSSTTRLGIGTLSPSYMLDVQGGSGIVAQFSGRVIGADAVNNNEFVTLGQLNSAVGGVGGGDGGVTTIGAIDGGTYSANGASISGTTMYLQSASATQVGLVTTGSQTFAGDKTFAGSTTVSTDSNSAFTVQNSAGTVNLIQADTNTNAVHLYDTLAQNLSVSAGSGVYFNGYYDRSTSTDRYIGAGGTAQLYQDTTNFYLLTGPVGGNPGDAISYINPFKVNLSTGAATFGSSVDAASGYKYNGTAGSTVSCTGGQVLQNQVVQGGIVTGGTCVANGGGVSGINNGTTAQTANYNIQGAANAFPVAKIDVGSSTGSILQVGDANFTGFVVDNAGINNFYGDAIFNGFASFANGIDAKSAGALDIGFTSGGNATSINLNQNTTVVGTLTATGNISTSGSFIANGETGVTGTCGGNQFFQGAIVTGGIITGGSCSSDGAVLLQGGSPGDAQTGNINITGTGLFGAVGTTTLDTASAAALSIGTTNASSIQIGKTSGSQNIIIGDGGAGTGTGIVSVGNTGTGATTIVASANGGIILNGSGVGVGGASNSATAFTVSNADSSITALTVDTTGGTGVNIANSLTVGGSALVKSDSAAALDVQTSTGTSVFTVDTTNSSVGIGTATPQAALEIANATIPQTRLTYTDGIYTDLKTTSTGNLELRTTGSEVNIGSISFSDQFNSSTLKSGWIFSDLRGDGSYSLTNVSGHLQLYASSATSHDCWESSLNCVRMMHAYGSGDNTFETKIDNLTLDTNNEGVGIMLWQDSANFIRFEFDYISGGPVKTGSYKTIAGNGSPAFATSTFNLSTSNYIRVVKSGDTYSMFASTNGTSWSLRGSVVLPGFTVSQAGIYVLNSSNLPAVTANFDYFTTTTATANLTVSGAGTFNSGLNVNGNSLFKSIANGATAFQIQNASGVALFAANTDSMNVTVGSATNGVILSANGIQLTGTARNAKKIVLMAEYAGAVLDAGTASNNTGTMTSGVNTANRMNFYRWTTSNTTTPQTYDVVVQVPIPSDFDSWTGATPSITLNTYTTDLTNGKLTLGLYDTAGGATSCVEGTTSITPGSASTWSTSSPSCTGGTYTAGGYMTLRIRMSALNGSTAQLGAITLNYLSKF